MIRPALALLLIAVSGWAQPPSAAKTVKDAHDLRGIRAEREEVVAVG